MYAYMYVGMYVCMYVCIWMYLYMYITDKPTMECTASPLHKISFNVVLIGREAPIVTSDMYNRLLFRTADNTEL